MMFVVSLVQIEGVDAGPKVTLGLGLTVTVVVKLDPIHPLAIGVTSYSTVPGTQIPFPKIRVC